MMAILTRASVDGAILVSAVWLLSRIVRLTPATRTMLWWCAAAKFVVALAWTAPLAIPILPAKQVIVHPASVDVAPRLKAIPDDGNGARGPQVRTTLAAPISGAVREWSSFAAIGWIAGLLLVAAVGARRWREATRMRVTSEPASADVRGRVSDLAARRGLKRVPEVRTSQVVETPLVIGLVRPVVLLPSDRFAALTERQQEMALCHELAHLKRADLWFGCVPAIAERIFFFHPLAHLASREYALWREAACDQAVVEALDAAPQEYGRLLLALGVSRPHAGLTAAGAAWSFLNLKRRIAMLQDVSVRSRRSRLVAAGAVALAVAAMVPMQLVARPSAAIVPEPALAVSEQQPTVSPEPERDAVQSESIQRADTDENFSFVLLSEGKPRVVSGRFANVDRARQLSRDGEPLLWFRVHEREYVIREPEVLRRIRSMWTPERHAPELAHHDAALAEAQALSGEAMVEHGKQMAEAQALSAEMLADHGKQVAEARALSAQVMAEHGTRVAEAQALSSEAFSEHMKLAMEQGRLAVERAMRDVQFDSLAADHVERALHEAREAMSKINHDDFAHHRREMESSARELEHRLKSGIDMRELHNQLRELEAPMHEMTEPLKELEHRMHSFVREIEATSRKANDEIRALVDRAVASGLAEIVK